MGRQANTKWRKRVAKVITFARSSFPSEVAEGRRLHGLFKGHRKFRSRRTR